MTFAPGSNKVKTQKKNFEGFISHQMAPKTRWNKESDQLFVFWPKMAHPIGNTLGYLGIKTHLNFIGIPMMSGQ